MENASKALLMAGGVILVMLIIGLVIFARSTFSDFYNQESELSEIKDLAEFNLQFTNYNREDVYGYELISLANRIADYNMRFSSDETARNDEGYSPISMKINITSDPINVTKLWSGYTAPALKAFQLGSVLLQTSTINGITDVIMKGTSIEKAYGNSNIASKLAKVKDNLIVTEEEVNSAVNMGTSLSVDEVRGNLQKTAVDSFNSIVRDESLKVTTYTEMVNKLKANDVNQYWEYMQFKKAIFKCITLDYNDKTGRVSNIEFEFTGNVE